MEVVCSWKCILSSLRWHSVLQLQSLIKAAKQKQTWKWKKSVYESPSQLPPFSSPLAQDSSAGHYPSMERGTSTHRQHTEEKCSSTNSCCLSRIWVPSCRRRTWRKGGREIASCPLVVLPHWTAVSTAGWSHQRLSRLVQNLFLGHPAPFPHSLSSTAGHGQDMIQHWEPSGWPIVFKDEWGTAVSWSTYFFLQNTVKLES